ncbi:pyruvate dehydrogenase E1 component subunit alpha, mitochondrial-like isoform X2 [Anabrus simplex]|uniref:pyruvate dehydrogenase E1 component subunit alpha, mitochondrial-like isoform X2 n=1 Tax=Anabrus simplex TaxID=316456 RepID=UPI0035A3BE3C
MDCKLNLIVPALVNVFGYYTFTGTPTRYVWSSDLILLLVQRCNKSNTTITDCTYITYRVLEVFSVYKRHKGNFETRIKVTPFQLHKLDSGPKEEVTLTRNEGLQIYEQLRMIRCLEVRATELYRAQFVRGFCHLYLGQEACCVGLRLAMRPKDSIITAYRCHGWAYVMGLTPHEVLAEMTGRKTGAVRGKGGSMHMFCPQFYGGNAIIGAHVPVGTGIAFAYKYRGEDGMCFACYGDGAANQGQVFEAYNIAKLWDLPIVFVCENNLYAMGTASNRSSANPRFYTRCDYIPGIWVDGMDVLAVREAGRFAVEWCSSGKGPLIYELHTYRYSGHSVSDPGTAYRTREEVKNVRRSRDPIELFKMHLLSSELATEEDIKEIDTKAKDAMDKAATKATEDPEPDLEELAGDLHLRPAEKFARGVGPWDKFEVKSFNTPMQTLP